MTDDDDVDTPISPIPYGDRSWMHDWIPSQVFYNDDGTRLEVFWNRRGPYRSETRDASGTIIATWPESTP